MKRILLVFICEHARCHNEVVMYTFGLSVPGHSIGSHLQFYLVIKVSYTKQSANIVQIIEIYRTNVYCNVVACQHKTGQGFSGFVPPLSSRAATNDYFDNRLIKRLLERLIDDYSTG